MTPEQLKAFHDFLPKAVTTVSTVSLYSSEHAQVQRLCGQAMAFLMEAMGAASEISLMVIEGELIHDGRPLPSGTYGSRFAQLLMNRGIGSLRITRGVPPQEMLSFLSSLSKKGDRQKAIRSSQNIRLGKLEVRTSQKGAQASRSKMSADRSEILNLSKDEMDKLMEIYEEVRKQKKLRVVGIHEIVSGLVLSLKQEALPFLALAPLRSMDEYTFAHSMNVCILNLSQAMALQVEGQLLHDIGIAAMLHDIGKLFLPPGLLTKQGALDQAEWALVRRHPLEGAKYLLNFPEIPRLAVVTAFEHHMKFNLEGYPIVPPGWQQNLCSQMTTISDFFDALRTSRSYRDSLALDELIPIMQNRIGIELHPVLTRNFFRILKPYHSVYSYEEKEKDLPRSPVNVT